MTMNPEKISREDLQGSIMLESATECVASAELGVMAMEILQYQDLNDF